MEVLWLSRLQFAVATLFHFLFCTLCNFLGFGVIVAIMVTSEPGMKVQENGEVLGKMCPSTLWWIVE